MKKNITSIRSMTIEDTDFVVSAFKKVSEASNQLSDEISFRKKIETDVFSNKPKAYIIVLIKNDIPIGMALYSTIYFANEGELMWLSNIYLEEKFRNHGYGKIILEYLKNICKEKEYYGICGAVEDNNELSKKFFNSTNCSWLNNFNMLYIKK